VVRKRQLVTKFFGDRGPHLAAMVAYFALLSFVPLTFLALALLGLAHRADASDFLVKELSHAFPGTSLGSILKLVHEVQDNAATLGIIGGVALLWSSLSLFSALESAFNIVYGLPNRSFLRGKALAATLMIATITLLFVSLLAGSLAGAASTVTSGRLRRDNPVSRGPDPGTAARGWRRADCAAAASPRGRHDWR